MNASLRPLLLTLAVGSLLSCPPAHATCGGGGGGGMGGAAPGDSSGRGEKPETYSVPWRLCGSGKALPADGASLLVLWFPTSAAASQGSDLLASRGLTQAAARCVVDVLVAPDNTAVRETYRVAAGTEVVVLAAPSGREIARLGRDARGRLEARAVEKLLAAEISAQEKAVKTQLDAAEQKAKRGDKSALEDLQAVWRHRCLFPALGKRAGKALQKLGVELKTAELESLGSDGLAEPDVAGAHADAGAALRAGLDAELAGDYEAARKHYVAAVELDPADATALRFLGEFYRHQTGEWNLAGRMFRRVLAQPADPVSRAVALHGLGKMTIHSGKFAEGLALFEESLAAYELPITYRNLAVYWFSEKQHEKAAGYMRRALALAPNNRYNRIFAAVYLAAAGQTDGALAVARENDDLLEASYNLAAIYAQAGDKAKAMEYLRRHFADYERYEPVRAMEMKEAREDYMFASLHRDADFDRLTRGAKNAWMIGAEFCAPDQLVPLTAPPGPRM